MGKAERSKKILLEQLAQIDLFSDGSIPQIVSPLVGRRPHQPGRHPEWAIVDVAVHSSVPVDAENAADPGNPAINHKSIKPVTPMNISPVLDSGY